MYGSKKCTRQENEKKIKMLALFNTLREEDKDIVISMSDLLVRKYGVYVKAETNRTGQKHGHFLTNTTN